MRGEFNRLRHSAEIGLAWLIQWNRVTQSQAARVGQTSAEWQQRRGDAFLLVMALRQVDRAARMVLDHERDDSRAEVIRDALRRFEARTPGVKETRDVLEHFDDYELGNGRLARAGSGPLRDWTPTAESAAKYVIDAGIGEDGLFVVRCGPYEVAVHDAAAAASDVCRTIQRLTYLPTEDEVDPEFDPSDLSDPRGYAMAFVAVLSQLIEGSRPRSEIQADLASLVAPETTPAWGDFSSVAQMVAGLGMGSHVDYAGEDVAYVKLVPDVGETAVLSKAILVPNAQIMTLQRRRDLPFEWYVYALGHPQPATELVWPTIT